MKRTPDFWVGDRLVRPSLGEIQLGPKRVHLEPRSMEVLLALAGSPSEVIPKEDLIAAVWKDAFVTDEVLTHAIWDLRRAFGDHASDPEFIQTIPKKGYRLIAPVKPMETELRRATDRVRAAAPKEHRRRPSTRVIAWGLTLVVVLIASGIWLSRERPQDPDPQAPARDALLLLVATEPPLENGHWAWRLDNRLRNELTGIDGVGIRRSPLCAAASDAKQTYCLEPLLLSITDGHQLTLRLKEANSGEEVYATPLTNVIDGDEVDNAAIEHAEIITAYFEVVRNKYAEDSDIRPWISTQRHDPRAIMDFLLGVEFVYLNETGGRNPMAVAIERDPGFVAPLVWRTPTMVAESAEGTQPPAALVEHRAHLKRLYDDANAFEKPMINWAIAFIDGDTPVAIRELKVALGQQPGNRPTSIILGAMQMGVQSYDQAWENFAPLLEERWRYPGLYSQAAQCALCRGRLDDVRSTLHVAEQFKPLDPEVLALLGLLAAHDGDTEKEAFYAASLERRKIEMLPEIVEIQLLCTDRLRESAN